LSAMLAWYRKKFKVEDVGHVLYALTYFDDAETERMPRMIWPAPWKQIKQTILDQVRDLSPTV
ncbi:MAG TPA: hypothetical protein VIJ36_00980, partial [Thermoanaerobaculia bacterium]